jgi:hypothetical protein
LSIGDIGVVRVVGRIPAKVHTKLLIAFLGTAVLVVAIGVLGLRVLAQSNDRVAALGALQERAAAYSELQSDTRHIRLLLAENPGRDFFTVWPIGLPRGHEASAGAVDQARAERTRADQARYPPRRARIRASCGGRARPSERPADECTAHNGDA